MMSLRQGRLAGVPRTGAKAAARPAPPAPSFCVPEKKNNEERAPPRRKERYFGRGRPRAPKRVGLRAADPDKSVGSELPQKEQPGYLGPSSTRGQGGASGGPAQGGSRLLLGRSGPGVGTLTQSAMSKGKARDGFLRGVSRQVWPLGKRT